MYASGAGGNRDRVAGLGAEHLPGRRDELGQDQRGGPRRGGLEVVARGAERPFERRGQARLASRVSSACSRRRWFLAETEPGGSSASAARSTSQSANSPSRFGPRTASPTSVSSRASAGVVACIT